MVDDTRLRLDQSTERRAAARERSLVEHADQATLTVDGKDYAVADTLSDVGEALYVAVARRQWADARRFLDRYQLMPGHDPMLIHYARGGLLREEQNLRGAEQEYRVLLVLDTDFLPGQLELARVLFENQQDREALALFARISGKLNPSDAKTDGIRRSVATFIDALNHRDGWQGSIAVGPTYNDNINQLSGSETCLLVDTDGTCFVNRKIPGSIGARGLQVEGTLGRHISLRGHHGLYLRTTAFGDVYDGQSRYNQATSTTQAGYEHRAAHDTWALAPSFDAGSCGTGLLYTAVGAHGEWIHDVSATTTLKLEADRKYLHYRQPGYDAYDGRLTDTFATLWHQFASRWTVFAGADLTDKGARDITTAYLQRGARIGFTRPLGDGFTAYASASIRQRHYRAYSELVEARRRDVERNLVLILGMPRFRFLGLTPSLTAQLGQVRSNVDWLYSYRRRQLDLKFEHSF